MMGELLEIDAGDVLWLPDDAEKRDPATYAISGLERGATDHPFLVTHVLGFGVEKRFLGHICGGTYRPNLGDIPIHGHGIEAESSHGKCACYCEKKEEVEMVFYREDVIQPKHTHIRIERVYLLSSKMLRTQRNTPHHHHFRLEESSLQIVLEKAAPVIQKFKERPEIVNILKKFPSPAYNFPPSPNKLALAPVNTIRSGSIRYVEPTNFQLTDLASQNLAYTIGDCVVLKVRGDRFAAAPIVFFGPDDDGEHAKATKKHLLPYGSHQTGVYRTYIALERWHIFVRSDIQDSTLSLVTGNRRVSDTLLTKMRTLKPYKQAKEAVEILFKECETQ